MPTYLLVASVTDNAREILATNKATIITLHAQAPHVELITLPQETIYHGRHPKDSYIAYTLNPTTGEGICYWDSNPVTCQLYSWQSRPEEISIFLEARGKHWPDGCIEEEAQIRPRIAELCERICQQPMVSQGNAWQIQEAFLDEWEAAMQGAGGLRVARKTITQNELVIWAFQLDHNSSASDGRQLYLKPVAGRDQAQRQAYGITVRREAILFADVGHRLVVAFIGIVGPALLFRHGGLLGLDGWLYMKLLGLSTVAAHNGVPPEYMMINCITRKR
jgi:hypothetical protein